MGPRTPKTASRSYDAGAQGEEIGTRLSGEENLNGNLKTNTITARADMFGVD